MNCKHVQDLLPLYVGRDLEEKPAELVTAHLKSCADCASSAIEYRETRQLLQQFTPPPVSEVVYAGIRRRVLREIDQESKQPALSELVASIFGARIGWAVATALLLAISALAFYFLANRRPFLSHDAQELAGNGKEQPSPDVGEGEPSRTPAVSVSYPPKENHHPHATGLGGRKGRDRTMARLIDQTHRGKSLGTTTDRAGFVRVEPGNTRPMTAAASSQDSNFAETDTLPARDPSASEKMLRVEMHTMNPNIRIIWFSPQPTRQNSPRKSLKGTPEVRSDV